MGSIRSERISKSSQPLLAPEGVMLVATLIASAMMLSIIFYPTLVNKLYIADDLGTFTIPLRHLYAEGLRAGRIDVWTPALFYGFYEHGEGQMGMFHPFNLLLYRLFPFVLAFGINLLAIDLALWAGSYFLFYRWTKDRIGAAFGAFVFAFAGSNMPAIVHVNRVAVVAHIPWMLWVIDRYIRRDGRQARYWWAAIALLNGSAILFGYPFWFGLCLVLQAWYLSYLIAEGASVRRAASAACGVTVGLLIGAIQLIPTWGLLQLSNRAHPSLGFLAFGSLHPVNVLQWLNPYLFRGRAMGGLALYEISIYAGIGPLLLFLWLCAREHRNCERLPLFLLGLALVGLFLSFGIYNGVFDFYSRLPGFNIFRNPGRLSQLTLFAIAGGSALAIKELGGSSRPSSSRLFNLLSALWLILSPITLLMRRAFLPMLHHDPFQASESRVLAGCAVVCAGIVLFWCALHRRGLWLAVFLIFSLCDISVYEASLLLRFPLGGFNYYEAERAPVPPSAPVAAEGDDDQLTMGGYHLVNGYAGLMPPDVLPLTDPNYLQALGVAAVQDGPSKWTTVVLPPSPRVRFELPFFSAKPIEAMRQVDLTKVAVLTRQVKVDASATGSVQIVDEHPGFLRIAAESNGPMFCVLVQRFHPGWTASMNGQKLDLMPVDGNLTGLVFPGGKQSIVLEFHPRDLSLGRNIALIGLLLLALGFLGHAWSARRLLY